jgi:hypothetical protein
MRINDNRYHFAWPQIDETWLQVTHLHSAPPLTQFACQSLNDSALARSIRAENDYLQFDLILRPWV